MSLERLLKQLDDPSELSWKSETYDLALAGGLLPTERTTFVAKLIEQAHEGDTRAILTLGHLKALEALPLVAAAAKGGDPWAETARRALVLFGKGADVLAEIANDAVRSPAKMVRIAAVLDLPKIGGAVALAALQEALLDEDSDVRVVAWDALVDALGLATRIQNPDGVRQLTTEIEVMRVLLASEITALVKLGASGIREVVRRLDGGATAQQLGIAWRPRQAEAVFDHLRRAMFDPDVPYPVLAVAGLKGPARQLAETMIVRRLEEWDARVPEVLVRLDAAWTAPALEELASSASAPTELQGRSSRTRRAHSRRRRWDLARLMAKTPAGWSTTEGRGTPVNFAQRVVWLARAAEAGDVDGLNELGVSLLRGLGEDPVAAVTMFLARGGAGSRARAVGSRQGSRARVVEIVERVPHDLRMLRAARSGG